MRNLCTVAFCIITSTAFAQGFLENPASDSFQSGQGIISGWHCDAQRIEVEIDNDIRATAAYGTPRGDTQGRCGDTNNGFGLQINWNILRDGDHTVRVLADGQQFAQASFTVKTLGTDVLLGESATCRVPRFPDASTDTILTWQEGLQNFTITNTVPTQGGSPPFDGRWHGVAEPNIAVAEGGMSCGRADVVITIKSPTFSGSLETDSGIEFILSGAATDDGVLAGTARRFGDYFAVLAGGASGSRITGRWNDIFGCWGDFELERD